MKKFCCLFMAVVLVFTLSACGPSQQSDPHTEKLANAEAFQNEGGLDFTFDSLPENMGAARYSVVDGAVAQVQFTLSERPIIRGLRISAGFTRALATRRCFCRKGISSPIQAPSTFTLPQSARIRARRWPAG